jgi:hypothetical protein
MEQSCTTFDRSQMGPASVTQVSSPFHHCAALQNTSASSWLGKGRKRRAILWGITSTVLSAIGLIGLALFEQYNGMLSELRSDLRHFNETSSDFVRKDRLQKCWDTMKECSRAMDALTAAKEQLEREVAAGERSRMELTKEMQRLRERLAYLEGMKMAKPSGSFTSAGHDMDP